MRLCTTHQHKKTTKRRRTNLREAGRFGGSESSDECFQQVGEDRSKLIPCLPDEVDNEISDKQSS